MQKETTLPSSEWRGAAWGFPLAGIIAPILFIVVVTVDGALRPGYSPVWQMISDLGAQGANTWIQNANFMVTGLLLLVFALGFYPAFHQVMGRRSLLVSTLLLGIAGIGLINDGIFTEEGFNNPLVSLHGVLHVVGFVVIFGSLIVAFFIIGRQLHKIPAWRAYGRYTTITAYATLVLFILIGPVPSHGLTNRLLIITAFAWYVVMGCRLFVLARAAK